MIDIAEVVMAHVSAQKRIEEFNRVASQLKLPYEGKIRKGYSQPFPYKAEIWIYKMKKEVVPEFLKFVNSNTSQVLTSERPLQGALNLIVSLMSAMSWLRDRWVNFRRWTQRKPPDRTKHTMEIVDMDNIEKGPKMVDGWGFTKVIGIIPDTINNENEEEL